MSARRIRALVLDVDGVLTDGRLWYGPRGESLKVFHVRDGHGIKQVIAAGVRIIVISGRQSAAVTRRCRELGIRDVHQGVADKLQLLRKLCSRSRIDLGEVACIGDDTPDVEILRAVGLSFAVHDAHPDARAVAQRITQAAGGRGAVREVCDSLLELRYVRRA